MHLARGGKVQKTHLDDMSLVKPGRAVLPSHGVVVKEDVTGLLSTSRKGRIVAMG